LPNDIISIHDKEYGTKAGLSIASAPGVLHLLGEYAEYARGHVLSMALQHRSWVSVSKRDDSSVRILAVNYKERKRFSLSNLKYKKEDRWANSCKGILAGLDTMGCHLHGLDICLYTDVPEHKGLGCSSSIAVALVVALVHSFQFELSDAQKVWLAHTADTTFVGRPGFLSCCFVSYFAHAGALFSMDIRNQEFRHLRLSQGAFSFWLMDSMVPAQGAREELQDRRQRFEASREILRQEGATRDLRDYDGRTAKEFATALPEEKRRGAIFAIEEETRHHLAEDCVEASNLPPLGKIISRSHDGVRDLLELSCPELDWVAKHGIMMSGVLGCRSTGKGLGACCYLLVEHEETVDFAAFKTEYERIFGFEPRLYRAVPSHRAQIHIPASDGSLEET